ncbi:hypothetical protein LMG31884_47530 (plasmid) [Xanthomonas hydrangeae]|uniref:hypothetical protein n=1 Tax=Xanthomonas hydrangeae TaxID=2775159 RepID=UPI001964ADE0|nr:hypothetical protein LMG31884_47530 [Xanthomonas hydrangeae]CAD7741302.1 hypothetical protein LMG31884_47530 [Xanthomonas hydrangeae]CAD7747924.1 hypothetical protein LMG31887_46330 [Xanthomonas hydrangeae]CAD7747925.1 hypothetical protein LMG31887_46330 [Xanthomonas hydrangeae]CAD7748198.1 hypothetical protein LMG31885_45160 [Xanthomonas hydrangeae]
MNRPNNQAFKQPAKSIEEEIQITIAAIQKQKEWLNADIQKLVMQHLTSALAAHLREDLDARDMALGDAVYEEQRVGPEDKRVALLEQFVDVMHVQTLGTLRQYYLDELSERLLDYAEENDERSAINAKSRKSLDNKRTWCNQDACSRASDLARSAAKHLEYGHSVRALSSLDEAAKLERDNAKPDENQLNVFHKELKKALERVSHAEAAWEKEDSIKEMLATFRVTTVELTP